MLKSSLIRLTRASIGLVALAAGSTLVAADGVQANHVLTINPKVEASIAAHEQKIAISKQRAHAHLVSKATKASSVAIGGSGFLNPSRAYPPSCLADGLPYGQASTDPNAQQGTLTVSGYNSKQGADITETDTFTVFRVPCSGNVSATLLEIDRPSSADIYNSYVYFPFIYLTSASNVQYAPRLPQDANTVYSDTAPLGEMAVSSIYVLEYYTGDNATVSGVPDFNQAFTLNISDVVINNDDINFDVPAYDPTVFNYPSASNPLEISGYTSGPWYDPAHSGEGMLIEVYDNGDQATRTLSATWYTFDNLGLPFWLSAQASIPIQDTTAGVTNGYQVVNAPVKYVTGGGFAGNFTPPVTINNWGTMSLSFQDCGTLNFSYSGATGTNASDGPAGSGTRQWKRIGDINGVVCQ